MLRTKTNYDELQFEHIIEYSKCGTLFAAARQDGFIKLFLIREFTGNVYRRNGRAEAWEPVTGYDRDRVLNVLLDSKSDTPLYRINARYQ